MKAVAKEERKSKQNALPQVSHLSGMLQAFQMSMSNPMMNMMSNQASTSRAAPVYIPNMFNHSLAIAPPQNNNESDSIESIKVPQYLLE